MYSFFRLMINDRVVLTINFVKTYMDVANRSAIAALGFDLALLLCLKEIVRVKH